MERFFLAALCRAPGVGSRVAASLVRVFGSAQDAWHARAEALRAAHLSPERAAALHDFCRRNEALPEEIAAACEKGGISLVVPSDEAYPALLKEIYNPPQTLFCRGSLDCLKHPAVAMVGARHASAYGKGAAEDIALGLAERGFVVVSGAARGIDTASHKGALQAGATVAVLGCGVDVAYPRENARLLAEIAEKGAVISEYAPGTAPLAAFFPARNRIISGVAHGTIVVEAAERSGSLITAEFALSEGRDVFAVPGSIYSATSRGCHRLIQQGARLVVSAADVAAEYEDGASRTSASPPQELTEEEAAVYALLSREAALSLDELICRLQGKAANVAFLLLGLRVKGLVEETPMRTYIRSAKGKSV